MNKSARLFAMAEVLRGRRTGITAESLAARFEVSVRTVMRDLEALRSSALPIHAERGRGGGIHLDKSYSMPPVAFTAREALVLLVLGRLATELRVLPFTHTLTGALDKLRATLPTATQREVARLSATLSHVGVPAHPVDADVRRVVEQAWFESAALRIVYNKADGTVSERRVRVDAVVLERSETLLNCRDLDKNAARQFKLHRIARATLERAPPATAA